MQSDRKDNIQSGILNVFQQQETRMEHKEERKDLPCTSMADVYKAMKPYKQSNTMRRQTP